MTDQFNSDENEEEDILLLSDVVKSTDKLYLPLFFLRDVVGQLCWPLTGQSHCSSDRMGANLEHVFNSKSYL